MEILAEIKDQIRALQAENISGASEIAARAAGLCIKLIEKSSFDNATQYKSFLDVLGRALIKAQPSMAPVFNLVNELLLFTENLYTVEEINRGILSISRKFERIIEDDNEKISEIAQMQIKDGMTIMTHSASSTVRGALLAAHQKGKSFGVICTESRPMREGVEFAKSLAGDGIKTHLIVDAAAGLHLPGVNLVFSGADNIYGDWVVNKVGTESLVLLAGMNHKKSYVLCSSKKFFPKVYESPAEAEKNPYEVLAGDHPGMKVHNMYFDKTYVRHFEGIITEKGIAKPAEIKARLEDIPVYSGFKKKLR